MRVLKVALWLLVCAGITIIGCSKHDSGNAGLKSKLEFTDPQSVRNSGAFGVYEDGWMGSEAEMTLGNPTHQPAFLLEGTNVETKPGDEALGILLLVGSDTLQILNIVGLGDFHETVVLPSKIKSADTLELRLVSKKTFVPSRLGTSKDDRSLSCRLKSISLVGMENTQTSSPSAFDFPRHAETDPNIQGVYSDGWIGDSASVTLFNPENVSTVEILGIVPGNIFPGVTTLDVEFEGKLLVKQQVSGDFRMRFQLPENALGASKLTLTLRPSGSFVPSDRGISNDTRRISYQLRYIRLR